MPVVIIQQARDSEVSHVIHTFENREKCLFFARHSMWDHVATHLTDWRTPAAFIELKDELLCNCQHWVRFVIIDEEVQSRS